MRRRRGRVREASLRVGSELDTAAVDYRLWLWRLWRFGLLQILDVVFRKQGMNELIRSTQVLRLQPSIPHLVLSWG